MFTIKFFIKKIKKFCFLSVKPLDKKGGGGGGGGGYNRSITLVFICNCKGVI